MLKKEVQSDADIYPARRWPRYHQSLLLSSPIARSIMNVSATPLDLRVSQIVASLFSPQRSRVSQSAIFGRSLLILSDNRRD